MYFLHMNLLSWIMNVRYMIREVLRNLGRMPLKVLRKYMENIVILRLTI